MDDKESQDNEILALESILEESSFKIDGRSGSIKVNPKFSSYPVKLNLIVDSNTCDPSTNRLYQVNFLPPCVLKFTLPENYPSSSPPKYALSCLWFSEEQTNKLCSRLDEIWSKSEGNVILYEWVQYLQDESMSFLTIVDVLDVRQDLNQKTEEENMNGAKLLKKQTSFDGELQPHTDLITLLLIYNQMKEEEKFNSSVFDCNICFESKVGSQCSQFKSCSHVYCIACLSSYFNVMITEGNVKSLKCPDIECEVQATPDQVQQLVDQDLFLRYERLLLQTTLDTMNDIVYCPLSHCQAPVIIDQDESLGQCPSCSYAFCVFCKLAYHGISPCKVSAGEIKKLVEEYNAADGEKKLFMEKKYGTKVLRSAMEEFESEKWLDSNAKSCPGCGARIEKIDGCNKMTCYKCRAYFCWLCLSILGKENPYAHFNKPNLPCYNRLFEGIDVEAMEFLF